VARVVQAMSTIWSDIDPRPTSLNDAVFGNSETGGLPADTSPGWPWTELGYKTKGDVFTDADAMQYIADDWERLDDDKYEPTGWTMNLKDELRPEAKRDKPRAFMGGPVELIVHAKRLFGRQDDAIGERPMATPVRVGFTQFHGGMRALWRRHVKRKYHWDGDYHNWDGSVPAWLFEACMQVRMSFLPNSQWQRVNNYYRSLVFAAMADPKGNLLPKYCGMPSGTYTTATDNSIMNFILLSMFEIDQGVDDFVISVYGDDNIVSTDHEVDIASLRAFMLELGLDYTSAEKSGPPEFKELLECTFLKMHFSDDPSRFPWREWERVYAILEWLKKDDAEIYYSCLNAVLTLSYGTTAYENVRKECDRLLDLSTNLPLLTDERVRQIVLGDWALPIRKLDTYSGQSIF
jgi:hypothetical protein